MSGRCPKCGELLTSHKDGRCDPMAVKRYRRRNASRELREEMKSIGMVRVRGPVSGETYWE